MVGRRSQRTPGWSTRVCDEIATRDFCAGAGARARPSTRTFCRRSYRSAAVLL